MTKSCAVDECDRVVSSRALCRLHYQRWRRTGETGESASRRVRGGRKWFCVDCKVEIYRGGRERCRDCANGIRKGVPITVVCQRCGRPRSDGEVYVRPSNGIVQCRPCLIERIEKHRGKGELLAYRKEQRSIVMERSGGKCESCGRSTKLEWDHVCGRGHLVSEPWASSHYLTVALCSFCHRQATDERNGVRAFTRSLCISALSKLAKEQGVYKLFSPEWTPLQEIQWYMRELKYPDAD